MVRGLGVLGADAWLFREIIIWPGTDAKVMR